MKTGQMKIKENRRERRGLFNILANEIDSAFCCFCKFLQPGSGCDDGGDCEHPLREHWGFPEVFEPGKDCWAFRPLISTRDCADIVGIILQKGWQRWQWSESEKGRIEVLGDSE